MSKPKKQHYVPQFLLRNFALGKKLKAKLWVLDKLNASVFQASVRDVGHENLFYAYNGEAGSVDFEGVMEKLDSKAASIIQDIISEHSLPEYGEKFIWLSYYVIAQMLRTPVTRRDLDNIRDIIVQKFGKEIVCQDDTRPIADYGPEDSKISSIRLLRDVPKLAKILQEKVWILCEAPDTSPFIIADNPVSRHNMVDRGLRGNLGLKNDGIEIYMPLSPRLAIQILCPKLAAATLLTPELADDFSGAMAKKKPVLYRPENVEFLNSLQVQWSERFVYARHREHLEMPLDMLRTHPVLREGTGVRQKPGEFDGASML